MFVCKKTSIADFLFSLNGENVIRLSIGIVILREEPFVTAQGKLCDDRRIPCEEILRLCFATAQNDNTRRSFGLCPQDDINVILC